MVAPSVFLHGSCKGIVVVGANVDLLLTQAYIIIIFGVGLRTATLEHVVVAVIEGETAYQHMTTLMTVAVETLDGTAIVVAEGDAVESIMDAL